MRSIKIGLGGLMVALAFSIGVTASASASGFLATKLEKLLSTKVVKQVFNTSAGTFECAEAKIEGGTSNDNGEQLTQLAVVEYSNCPFFGFIGKFTPADFLFEANGKVKLDNLIKLTALGVSCEISYPAQTFGTMLYGNSGKNIKLTPEVTNMLYDAAGCTSNGHFKNGTYQGTFEMMIANGTLSFMP